MCLPIKVDRILSSGASGPQKWSKPAMLSIPPVETPKLVSSPTPAKQPKKRKAGSEMKEGTVRNKTQNSTPKAKPSMPNDILVDSPTGGTKSSRSKSGFFGVSADRSRYHLLMPLETHSLLNGACMH